MNALDDMEAAPYLRQQIAKLQAENSKLSKKLEYWRDTARDAHKQIAALREIMGE